MKKMLLLRVVLILLGSAGTGWFLLPFFSRKIINIGNLTGIALSLAILSIGLFLPQFKMLFFEVAKGGGIKKAALKAIVVLFFFLLMLAAIITTKIWIGAMEKPKKNATAVVLGCRVYGTNPSLMLRERLEAAYIYLNENPNAKCIVSGGKGEGEEITEARAMKLYLVKKGIEAKRIFEEGNSFNTRENIALSLEIIKKEGLPDEIAIVTNEFHLYRARRIAEKQGLKAGAIAGKTAWWLLPTYYVREMYSVLYEWIR